MPPSVCVSMLNMTKFSAKCKLAGTIHYSLSFISRDQGIFISTFFNIYTFFEALFVYSAYVT